MHSLTSVKWINLQKTIPKSKVMVIEVGSFPWYPLMILLSLVASSILTVCLFRKGKIPAVYTAFCLTMNILLIMFGGFFLSSALTGFRRIGGLASIGGVFGFLAAGLFNARVLPEYKNTIWKSVTLSIPLMYSVSKLGCHLEGCCVGMKYDGLGAISYHGNVPHLVEGNLFPVQLTENVVFAIIFVVAVILYKKERAYNSLVVISLCCVGKGLLDFLRLRDNLISFNQIICVLILLIAFGMYFFKKRNVGEIRV